MKEEQKAKLGKFIKDPDWNIIEDCLNEYIDPLIDISNIDLKDDSDVIKAELKVRQQLHSGIKSFLTDIGLLSEQLPNTKPKSFR